MGLCVLKGGCIALERTARVTLLIGSQANGRGLRNASIGPLFLDRSFFVAVVVRSSRQIPVV